MHKAMEYDKRTKNNGKKTSCNEQETVAEPDEANAKVAVIKATRELREDFKESASAD